MANSVPVPGRRRYRSGPSRGPLRWLIVRLRFPIVVAWIAAAVFMTMNLPSIGDAGGGELGGVVPEHSQAVACREGIAAAVQLSR